MKNCPCGSGKTLAACCALIHADESLAVAAAQLMRARYTAFVTANIDFVLRTYHSRCNSHSERDEIAVAAEIDWIKLQIMDSPEAVDDTAFVEFKAWFMEDGQLQLLHERSRFLREQVGEHRYWRYIDGTFPAPAQSDNTATVTKVGRNAPCPCNSGKKHKKCCGK